MPEIEIAVGKLAVYLVILFLVMGGVMLLWAVMSLTRVTSYHAEHHVPRPQQPTSAWPKRAWEKPELRMEEPGAVARRLHGKDVG